MCSMLFKYKQERTEYWFDNPQLKQVGGGQNRYASGHGISCKVILYSISGLRCLAGAIKKADTRKPSKTLASFFLFLDYSV